MVTKRKFNSAAKAKARKAHQGKKGKKKKGTSGADWYTNDGHMGMFSGFAKEGKDTAPHGAKSFENDNEEIAWRDSSRVDKNDDDEERINYEENSSDDEPPAVAAFTQLMQGLESSKKQLDSVERSVLNRVLSEQEGVDYVGSESDSNSSEEEDSQDEDEDGSHGKKTKTIDKDDDDQDGDDKNEAAGSKFEKRFVSMYSLNDEEALDALKEEGLLEGVSRSKNKVFIGTQRYSVTTIAGVPGSRSIGSTSNEFMSSPVNVDNVEVAAARLELKLRLAKRWLQYTKRRHKICTRRLGCENTPLRNEFGLTELQEGLLPAVQEYSDVVFTSQSLDNASELRELYALHALNHVYKSIDQVSKHTQRLKVQRELERRRREANQISSAVKSNSRKNKDKNKNDEQSNTQDAALLQQEAKELDEIDENLFRDQGFTRPRVLILVPNRLAGLRVVRVMLDLLPENANIGDKARFWEEFSEEDMDEEGNELADAMARVKLEKVTAAESYDELYFSKGQHPVLAQEQSKGSSARPADWHSIFSGNNDECFKMGITVSGRKLVTLFADFYRSDIIIATPVGLRMATRQLVGDGHAEESGGDSDSNSEGDEDDEEQGLAELGLDSKREDRLRENKQRKEQTDFLSSIELCVVDQADVLEMQNWQHVLDIMSAVNRKPTELREDMDFGRVRKYFLVDGLARRFRQTLVFAKHPSALLNALVVPKTAASLNVAGLELLRPASFEGVLQDITVNSLSHKFVRMESTAATSCDYVAMDPHFHYFETNVMRALRRRDAVHTLLLVPSFLDFVPVRNLLSKIAAAQGEIGPRAKGKPWRGLSRKRKRMRDGTRAKVNGGAEIPQALFVCISEYTDIPDIARARGDFCHGRARILLVTERFYFYNRFKIRGIQRAVFYAPPTHASFYPELANVNEASNNTANLVLFDQSDCVALERLVGTSNAKEMLKNKRTVFDISPLRQLQRDDDKK